MSPCAARCNASRLELLTTATLERPCPPSWRDLGRELGWSERVLENLAETLTLTEQLSLFVTASVIAHWTVDGSRLVWVPGGPEATTEDHFHANQVLNYLVEHRCGSHTRCNVARFTEEITGVEAVAPSSACSSWVLLDTFDPLRLAVMPSSSKLTVWHDPPKEQPPQLEAPAAVHVAATEKPSKKRASKPAKEPKPPKPPKELPRIWMPPAGWYEVWADGSGTLKETPGGSGVVIYRDGEALVEGSWSLKLASNNHAEIVAIGLGLALVYELTQSFDVPFVLYSDSRFALDATNPGIDWDLWHLPLGKPAAKAKQLRSQFTAARFEKVPGHEGLVGNERADFLASIARLNVAERERRAGLIEKWAAKLEAAQQKEKAA